MDVVVSNPTNNAESCKKKGVTCLMTEARKGESDRKKKLEQLMHSLEQLDSRLGIAQVVDSSSIDTLPAVVLDNAQLGHLALISFPSPNQISHL